MDVELKQKWLDALRGTDYIQGRDRLVRVEEDGQEFHCCLGVLADVLEIPRVADRFQFPAGSDAGNLVLPHELACELGLDRPSEDDEDTPIMNRLAGMNDSGVFFTEIADYIESIDF